jgi:hypothetical protein
MVAAGRALASAPPPIVRVYVAGAPEAVAGSRDAIQDVCSRSNVAVVVRDAAGADEALLATERAPGLAEAYVDLRPGTPPRVVVVDSQTRQDLERRTLPDGASLEISIETVARIVCSAVESSLAARAANPNANRGSAKLSAAAAPRRVDRGSEWAARVDVFGAAENVGAGFHGGAGAAIGVTYGRSVWRAGVLASVIGYAAADVQVGPALAAFGLIGARALPLLEWRASSALTTFVGVGGGVDWTRVRAERAPLGGAASGASVSADVIGAGIVGARWGISQNFSALLALDADVDLDRHRYVITTPDGSRSLFEPARVRPMALLGLSLAFGGPDSSAASAALLSEERP